MNLVGDVSLFSGLEARSLLVGLGLSASSSVLSVRNYWFVTQMSELLLGRSLSWRDGLTRDRASFRYFAPNER